MSTPLDDAVAKLKKALQHAAGPVSQFMDDVLILADDLPGNVVTLSSHSGPSIRHVRTPEGAKKYGQPIGSVILKDASGHIHLLHKGSGTMEGAPPLSAYDHELQKAEYGGAQSGTFTHAGSTAHTLHGPLNNPPEGLKEVLGIKSTKGEDKADEGLKPSDIKIESLSSNSTSATFMVSGAKVPGTNNNYQVKHIVSPKDKWVVQAGGEWHEVKDKADAAKFIAEHGEKPGAASKPKKEDKPEAEKPQTKMISHSSGSGKIEIPDVPGQKVFESAQNAPLGVGFWVGTGNDFKFYTHNSHGQPAGPKGGKPWKLSESDLKSVKGTKEVGAPEPKKDEHVSESQYTKPTQSSATGIIYKNSDLAANVKEDKSLSLDQLHDKYPDSKSVHTTKKFQGKVSWHLSSNYTDENGDPARIDFNDGKWTVQVGIKHYDAASFMDAKQFIAVQGKKSHEPPKAEVPEVGKTETFKHSKHGHLNAPYDAEAGDTAHQVGPGILTVHKNGTGHLTEPGKEPKPIKNTAGWMKYKPKKVEPLSEDQKGEFAGSAAQSWNLARANDVKSPKKVDKADYSTSPVQNGWNMSEQDLRAGNVWVLPSKRLSTDAEHRAVVVNPGDKVYSESSGGYSLGGNKPVLTTYYVTHSDGSGTLYVPGKEPKKIPDLTDDLLKDLHQVTGPDLPLAQPGVWTLHPKAKSHNDLKFTVTPGTRVAIRQDKNGLSALVIHPDKTFDLLYSKPGDDKHGLEHGLGHMVDVYTKGTESTQYSKTTSHAVSTPPPEFGKVTTVAEAEAKPEENKATLEMIQKAAQEMQVKKQNIKKILEFNKKNSMSAGEHTVKYNDTDKVFVHANSGDVLVQNPNGSGAVYDSNGMHAVDAEKAQHFIDAKIDSKQVGKVTLKNVGSTQVYPKPQAEKSSGTAAVPENAKFTVSAASVSKTLSAGHKKSQTNATKVSGYHKTSSGFKVQAVKNNVGEPTGDAIVSFNFPDYGDMYSPQGKKTAESAGGWDNYAKQQVEAYRKTLEAAGFKVTDYKSHHPSDGPHLLVSAYSKAEKPQAEKKSSPSETLHAGKISVDKIEAGNITAEKATPSAASVDISAVKATKVGENSHGKIWEFQTHTHNGQKIQAVPGKNGIVLNLGDKDHAGPFKQMKEAKAWVAQHSTATEAPAASTSKTAAVDQAAAKIKSQSPFAHVKATKSGSMYGKPIWKFTSHTHEGKDIYAYPQQNGKYALYTDPNEPQIAGPFLQMKEAKAWVNEHGTSASSEPQQEKISAPAKAAEKVAPKSPVKATKVGENSHGKIWKITSHTYGDDPVYAVPSKQGIYLHGGSESGPLASLKVFPQMKDAKAWVEKNGVQVAAEKPSTPEPEKADVPHVTKATDEQIAQAKSSVMKPSKSVSTISGGVGGAAADKNHAMAKAFLTAAQIDKPVYVMPTANGYQTGDYKPQQGFAVHPDGSIDDINYSTSKPVKIVPGFWDKALEKYTKPKAAAPKSVGPSASGMTVLHHPTLDQDVPLPLKSGDKVYQIPNGYFVTHGNAKEGTLYNFLSAKPVVHEHIPAAVITAHPKTKQIDPNEHKSAAGQKTLNESEAGTIKPEIPSYLKVADEELHEAIFGNSHGQYLKIGAGKDPSVVLFQPNSTKEVHGIHAKGTPEQYLNSGVYNFVPLNESAEKAQKKYAKASTAVDKAAAEVKSGGTATTHEQHLKYVAKQTGYATPDDKTGGMEIKAYQHDKYGPMNVAVRPDSSVYQTGVGLVVVHKNHYGQVYSGKTGQMKVQGSPKVPKSAKIAMPVKVADAPGEQPTIPEKISLPTTGGGKNVPVPVGDDDKIFQAGTGIMLLHPDGTAEMYYASLAPKSLTPGVVKALQKLQSTQQIGKDGLPLTKPGAVGNLQSKLAQKKSVPEGAPEGSSLWVVTNPHNGKHVDVYAKDGDQFYGTPSGNIYVQTPAGYGYLQGPQASGTITLHPPKTQTTLAAEKNIAAGKWLPINDEAKDAVEKAKIEAEMPDAPTKILNHPGSGPIEIPDVPGQKIYFQEGITGGYLVGKDGHFWLYDANGVAGEEAIIPESQFASAGFVLADEHGVPIKTESGEKIKPETMVNPENPVKAPTVATGAVAAQNLPGMFTAKDVKVSAGTGESVWVAKDFTKDGDPLTISLDVESGKWKVTSGTETLATDLKTLKAGKEWVAANGEPSDALASKAKADELAKKTSVGDTGASFEWNGQKYLIPLGAKAWQDEDGNTLYVHGGGVFQDYTATSSGVHTSGLEGYTVAQLNKSMVKVASAPSPTLGKYTPKSADPSATAPESLKDYLSGNAYSLYSVTNSLLDGDRPAADAAQDLDALYAHISKKVGDKPKGDNAKVLASLEIAARVWHEKASAEAGEPVAMANTAFVLARLDVLSKKFNLGYTLAKQTQAQINPMRDRYVAAYAKSEGYDVGENLDNDAEIRKMATAYGVDFAAGLKGKVATSWVRTVVQAQGNANAYANIRAQALSQVFLAKAANTKHLTPSEAPALNEQVAALHGSFEQVAGMKSAVESYDNVPNQYTALSTHLQGTLILPGYSADPEDKAAAVDMAKHGDFYLLSTVYPSGWNEVSPSALQLQREAFYHHVLQTDPDPEAAAKKDGYTDPKAIDTYVKAFNTIKGDYSAGVFTPGTQAEGEAFDGASKTATKPTGVSKEMWEFINDAYHEPTKYLTPAQLQDGTQSSAYALANATKISPALFESKDPSLQVLAHPALVSTFSSAEEKKQYFSALGAIASTGVWGTPYAEKYHAESSNVDLYLKPGDKVWANYSGTFVVNEFSPNSGYKVTSNGTFSALPAGFDLSQYYSVELKHEVAAKVDYDFVNDRLGSDFPLTEHQFDLISKAAKADYAQAAVDFPMSGVTKGDSLLAVSKGLGGLSEDFQPLKDIGVEKMPDGLLRAVHHAMVNGDIGTLAAISLLAQYKFYDADIQKNTAMQKLGVPADASYLPLLKGSALAKEDLLSWPNADLSAAIQDVIGDSMPNASLTDKVSALTVAFNEGNLPNDHKSGLDELVLTPLSKTLGGMHSKKVWSDQHGQEWMSKDFPSDPNSDARVTAEHYAMEISRLYGFDAPASRLMELGGKLAYVQNLAPAADNPELSGRRWDDLPRTAALDAMAEHVIDWVISNHDSHGGNLLLTPDGQHVYGIDKGQAGRFFGNDKLAEGYKASNPEYTWYDNVYADIRQGLMPQDVADQFRDHVLRKAAAVSTRSEKQHREMLTRMFEHHNASAMPKGMSKDAVIDAYMARRKAAFDDFSKLYQDLYKKAGYDWGDKTSIDDYLPKKVGEVHIEPSQDFTKDVVASGTYGQPLMFAGSELSSSYLQTYVTQNTAGEHTLRAQGKLLSGADSTFVAWLKNHTIEKVDSAGPSTGMSQEAQDKQEASSLPYMSQAHSALVAYAKTVSHHAADGEYNQATVTAGQEAKAKLQEMYDEVTKVTQANPLALASGTGWQFKTAEQQDTWLVHAKQVLANYALTDQAKAQGVKVSSLANGDEFPFQQPVYSPTPNLNNSGTPKPVAAHKYNGKIFLKYDDGNYVAKDAKTSTLTKSTPGDFAEAQESGTDVTATEVPEEAKPEGDVENVVSVANKVVKVSYRPSTSYQGIFDPKAGIVVESGDNGVSMTGHEYEIQYGNLTLRYQPRSGAGTAGAQQGLLRLEVSDWDGEPGAIEEAIDLLRGAGLKMDSATEESLEISYYRNLVGVAKERSHPGSLGKAIEDSDKILPGSADELKRLRTAWAGFYGQEVMDKFIKRQGFLPQVGKSHTGKSAGRPVWLRPDASVSTYKERVHGRLPVHDIAFSGNDLHASALGIGTSGYFGTEERMRMLGRWLGGNSSGPDQSNHGSSDYTYWRQNIVPKGEYKIYAEPEVALRINNYSANGDTYGDSGTKLHSNFDLQKMATSSTSGGNELMVKSAVNAYDGIAFITVPEKTRDALLKFYKDLGITEINGVPIAEKFILPKDAEKMSEKVWERAIAREKAHGKA